MTSCPTLPIIEVLWIESFIVCFNICPSGEGIGDADNKGPQRGGAPAWEQGLHLLAGGHYHLPLIESWWARDYCVVIKVCMLEVYGLCPVSPPQRVCGLLMPSLCYTFACLPNTSPPSALPWRHADGDRHQEEHGPLRWNFVLRPWGWAGGVHFLSLRCRTRWKSPRRCAPTTRWSV